MTTRHYWVSGKVQGVYFRASTKKRADALGLSGWVRNVPDGRVEVMVSGEADTIERFEAWLRRGPVMAKVTHLEASEMAEQVFTGFEVR